MSSKEELILDIVEKTYEQIENLRSDVSEMKTQQALHDFVVKKHEARSTNLEDRVEILEKERLDHERRRAMIDGGIKVILGLATIIGLFVKIIPYLLVR